MGREARRTLAMPSLFAEVSAYVRTRARAFVKMRMELMCQLSATAYECATKTPRSTVAAVSRRMQTNQPIEVSA
jgi:hypothetical protein